jgi:hypothetical protein
MLASAFLAVVLGVAAVSPYAQMAPLANYMMPDRQAEIRLARSAAPAAISQHATVLVLTTKGFTTAQRGTNGFTCVVERSWDNPFDAAEFWNWKIRSPNCFNAAASHTVLHFVLFRAKLAVAGATKSAMLDRTKAAVAANVVPTPEPGAMAYMMSKQQYLGDDGKAWVPHVMVFTPKADSANHGAAWGADLAGSPVMFDTSKRIIPEPWTAFMIPVATWSDGSPAPSP